MKKMSDLINKMVEFRSADKDYILVQNIPGTTGEDDHSWCKDWGEYNDENVTGSMTCSVLGCTTKLVPDQRCGAHVRVVDNHYPEMHGVDYIVPTCKGHNNSHNTNFYYVLKDRLVLKEKLDS